MPTLVQTFIERGKVEGRVEGRIEGEARGKTDLILRLLTRRWGTFPEMLEEKLMEINDLERLDQLWDVAYDCRSLDEFEDALKNGN